MGMKQLRWSLHQLLTKRHMLHQWVWYPMLAREKRMLRSNLLSQLLKVPGDSVKPSVDLRDAVAITSEKIANPR